MSAAITTITSNLTRKNRSFCRSAALVEIAGAVAVVRAGSAVVRAGSAEVLGCVAVAVPALDVGVSGNRWGSLAVAGAAVVSVDADQDPWVNSSFSTWRVAAAGS
jgi:hypothetical protein